MSTDEQPAIFQLGFKKRRNENMKFFLGACIALLIFMPLGLRAQSAYPCVISGPRYQLVADTVSWSIRIESGQSCIHGLRFNNVVIENVRLIAPPQFGETVLRGPGFTYTANSNYQGEDSFVVMVSGSIMRIHGSSTIRVSISVVNPPPWDIQRNGSVGPDTSGNRTNFILDGARGYILDESGGKVTAF